MTIYRIDVDDADGTVRWLGEEQPVPTPPPDEPAPTEPAPEEPAPEEPTPEEPTPEQPPDEPAPAPEPSPTPPGGSYAVPNLLNNADFETGYDGFDNGSTGHADVPRVTTHAYTGRYSLEFDFPASSREVRHNARYGFGEISDLVFARAYFLLRGAMPTQSGKIFRVANAYYDGPHFGVYAHANGSGNLIAAFETTGNDNVDLGIGNPTPDVWHSIEFEYAYNGGAKGGDAARFWYDNEPVFKAGGGGNGAPAWRDLSGDGHYWLDSDQIRPGKKPGAIWLPDTVNGGNRSHTIFHVDRVAVSTERIGP